MFAYFEGLPGAFSFIPTLTATGGERAYYEYPAALGLPPNIGALGANPNANPHRDSAYTINQYNRDPLLQRSTLQPFVSP